MTDTDCRPADRFEQLVRIWRALSPTRQSRWTRRVLAMGTRPGLMDRIAIAAAMPSVPVPLGSLGLDFFREVHQQARLKHRDRARRLADDARSYRAGADAFSLARTRLELTIDEMGKAGRGNLGDRRTSARVSPRERSGARRPRASVSGSPRGEGPRSN